MITIKKVLFFFSLFFLFNTLQIDSNSDKVLIYNKENVHLKDTFQIYFKDLNSNELKNILDLLDIRVLSYIINDKKYYARNIDELVSEFIKDKKIEEKVYYENNGITIDGINILCEVNELIKLENLASVY